jgi:hypothetical protein
MCSKLISFFELKSGFTYIVAFHLLKNVKTGNPPDKSGLLWNRISR